MFGILGYSRLYINLRTKKRAEVASAAVANSCCWCFLLLELLLLLLLDCRITGSLDCWLWIL